MNKQEKTEIQNNRRPIKAREWSFINTSARWATARNISPNAISLASIGFSSLSAAALFFLSPSLYPMVPIILPILVFIGLAGRGWCNIVDGLVAIEGDKKTKSGELFNDIPDRLSDILVLVSAGYAAGEPSLGWCAATLAVMTAYVRVLGRSMGGPANFQGPMAKARRMVLIAISTALSPFISPTIAFTVTLIIIIIGCIITIGNRVHATYLFCEDLKND